MLTPCPEPTSALARHPHGHADARRLAEAVAAAWRSSSYSHRIDVPLSIVAALALIPVKDHPVEVARIITGSSDRELLQGLREVWVHQWAQRPELAPVMAPLTGWLAEERAAELAHPVRRVVEVCLRRGLLEMTGSGDPYERSRVDVLSWTLMELRSRGARQGLGEFHTPPEVCQAIAAMLLSDQLPPAGQRFVEPAGGSGGMFRAAAQHLREQGGDPADYEWWLVELDPLAAAAAAVNAVVWGLGDRVVVACGDALGDPLVAERAAAARCRLREERDELLGKVAVVEAVRAAIALVDRVTAERQR